MRLNQISKFAIVSVVVLVLALLLGGSAKTNLTVEEVNKALEPFFDSLSYILNYYYEADKLDINKLIDHAIDGLVKGTGDDFSYYQDPETYRENQIEMKGEYGGLGIEVTYDAEHGAIKVVAPMYGTPAWRAGLKAGDLIITIDGTPVSKMTYMEAVNNLRGEPGTSVTIEVLRDGEKLTFTIVREKIEIKMVLYSFIETEKGSIGYVRITRFGEKADSDTKNALDKIFEKGVKGLIVDVRDNPGGYLDVALKIVSMFVDKGVILKVRNGFGEEDVYESYGNSYPNVPIVLLVNEGSASASEILTGALKDLGIATVVGRKTFGKGSVQTGFPLSNGGVLFLTTAHYLTPSGKDIHKIGIEPDVLVEESVEEELHAETREQIEVDPEKDPFVKKGLEVLLEKIK
ncbi:MAG: carboxyl-terminal protease [Thermotoga sp.]|jgi:carboxyl-terminal processing protease|nr:carboxyl-terminal protease [Thermotoga sp.]